MRCPVCDVTMREVTRRGVTIDICPECKGVWLDRGELDHLIEAEPEIDPVQTTGVARGREDVRDPRFGESRARSDVDDVRPRESSEPRYRRDSSDDDRERRSGGFGGLGRRDSDDDRYRSGGGSSGTAPRRKKKSWLSEMFEFGE